MEEIALCVDSRHAGKRLDRFLVDVLEHRFSRSFLKKLIDGETVFVNEKNTSAHHKVSASDTVRIIIPDPKTLELEPEERDLEIAYEDSELIVVNKPAGMLTHPAPAQTSGTLVNALLFHCTDLSHIGGVLRPGIVHRLDRDTSGLLVVAKSDAAHSNLSNQFKKRRTKRIYIAIVRGIVQLDNGKIELPLARRRPDFTKMGVSFVDTAKKHAITTYRVLKRCVDFTVLELSLGTGRTHQIRVHLSYIGYPIVGDSLYGSAKGLDRHALHAKTLGFFHPATKQFMEFTSDLPGDMQGLIQRGRL
jgi:23S rRNA pseudouridine1911/1915/1917 synthase